MISNDTILNVSNYCEENKLTSLPIFPKIIELQSNRNNLPYTELNGYKKAVPRIKWL